MNFIIGNEEKKIYYKQAKSGSSLVSNKKEATFWTNEKKAGNALKTVLQSKKFGKYDLRLLEREVEGAVIVASVNPEEICSVSTLEALSFITGGIESLENRLIELRDRHRELEHSQQDLLHLIELNEYNACEGYKRYKELHDLRKERRRVKDEVVVLQRLLGVLPSTETLEQTKSLALSSTTRYYIPRSDKSLFGDS